MESIAADVQLCVRRINIETLGILMMPPSGSIVTLLSTVYYPNKVKYPPRKYKNS